MVKSEKTHALSQEGEPPRPREAEVIPIRRGVNVPPKIVGPEEERERRINREFLSWLFFQR